MIFGRTKMELKVGIFIFIALIILIVFVLYIGGIQTWGAAYNIVLDFGFANGVKEGAPVRFAGVDVGQVEELNFFRTPDDDIRVHVVARVRDEVRIPVDSEIEVNTLGLLGEKYIEIIPGEDWKHFVMENQKIVGNDPVPMHRITRMAKDVVHNIDSLVVNLDDSVTRIKNQEGTLGKILYNDQLYREIEAMIIDLKNHPWKLFWKTTEK
ncbi:MAG: MCE family protein [Candidatus Omnitrophica bacterium]|nr:MCE family protein [Candidatus Omnitrophota bacterium]